MRKDNFISLRVDDTEKRVIKDLSEKYGKSQSEICRLLIDGRMEDLTRYARRMRMTPEQYDGVLKALDSLRKPLSKVQISLTAIGNNMNQIARICNSGRVPKNLEKSFNAMEESFNKLKEMLELYGIAADVYVYGKGEDDDDGQNTHHALSWTGCNMSLHS